MGYAARGALDARASAPGARGVAGPRWLSDSRGRWLARQLVDQPADFFEVERLLDPAVDRRDQELARRRGERAAGEEHDPERLGRVEADDLGVQLHAGDLRHHEIAQDDVVPRAQLEQIERVARAVHRGDVVLDAEEP